MPKSPSTKKPRAAPKKPKAISKNPKLTTATFACDSAATHLTAFDWLSVFKYINNNPGIFQSQVVNYFSTQSNKLRGSLKFTQGALSKALPKRAAIKKRTEQNANGLTPRCVRIVKCPEVDRALSIWAKDMENQKISVTGVMLIEKRSCIETLMQIPDGKRMKGKGWVDLFKSANGLKEFKTHGEAASVDMSKIQPEITVEQISIH